MNTNNKSIAVIGAGIIGLSVSYYIAKCGYQVTLYDSSEPGSGTSRGHMNVIASYGLPAINQPDIWRNIPSYLFSKKSPVAVQWNYLPKMTSWLLQFLKNCHVQGMEKTASQLSPLLSQALGNYQELLQEIQGQELLTHKGVLYTWIKKSNQPTHHQVRIREQFGIEQQKLSREQIFELEPELSRELQGAWYFPKAHHTINPDKILKKIFQSFLHRQGEFIQKKINSISFQDSKPFLDNRVFDQVVICSGAFSKLLADQLEKISIPLEAERGYHVEYPGMQSLVSRPVSLADSGMYVTPLDYALRGGGTVELGGLHTKLTQARIDYIHSDAKRLLPKLQDYQNPWLGYRPTLPDCLPVIGPSSQHPQIYYAFGHNHLGWTLGPTTGKLIAAMINQKQTPIQELSIRRFQ